MIRRVRVQGFKSLDDVEVEFGVLNVFVGANGAGKTNLLEAIGLAGAAVFGQVDDESLIRRGVRPGLPTLYKTAFKGHGIRRTIKLELDNGDPRYEASLDNPIKNPDAAWRFTHESVSIGEQSIASRSPRGTTLLYSDGRRPIDVDSRRGLAPLARTVSRNKDLHALLDRVERYAIYTPFTPMLRGTTPDTSAARPLGLNGGGLADAVRELGGPQAKQLRQVIARLVDWSDRVGSGTASQAQLSPSVRSTANVLRFHDRHMVTGRDWLSGYDASEGALYVTFLVVLALHPDSPRFLAVDNVDQALNPRLAESLIAEVQRILLADPNPRQFLLTAHNPLVLDALDLADDRVRLFVIDRDANGATTVRRIAYSDALTRAKKEGMSLSRLWLAGFLGGMPNL